MKRFLQYIVTVVGAFALMVGVLGASPASAFNNTSESASAHSVSKQDDIAPKAASDSHDTDFEEQCNQDGNVSTCTSGSASTDTDSKAKIKRLKMNGRVVGEYLVEGGLTRKQVKQSRCYTSHDGWNTLRTSDGKIAKYRDKRAQKICRTGNGPSGWQVVKCGNFYWPAKKRPKRFITVKNPVLVQSFNDYELKGVVKGKAVTTAKAFSASTATCTGSSSTASASGKAGSAARFRLSFKFRGKRNVQAEGERVVEEYALRLNVKAYGEARSESSADAATAASCTDTPNPEPDKPVISATARACVNPGQSDGVIDVTIVNNNDVAPIGNSFGVNGKGGGFEIGPNQTITRSLTGFAPGQYTVTVEFGEPINLSEVTSVTVEQCDVPVDNPPQISCVFPPHVYAGGSQYFWCNASDPNGDPLSVSITGDSNAHVAPVIKVTPGGDGYNESLCDSQQTCYRATLWGDEVGDTTVTANVVANGVSGSASVGTIKVLDPNDGF